MYKIFIIEEEDRWRKFFKEAFSSEYEVRFWPDGKDLVPELKSKHFDVIILDMHMKHEEAFEHLRWIKSTMPATAVIMTSQTEKAELIVRALKQGAFDFLVKPVSGERIRHAVEQALEFRSLRNEIDYLRHEQDIIYDFDRIIAFSPAMKEVMKTLEKFSRTDSTILLTGETGTGKSFLSGHIHFNSHRRNKPFVKINCANIPETLLESELFGHEKGAFTGAVKTRVGRFEQAGGGTLFLDEIGEISLPLQLKLLRVLEEKSFERVGGNKTIYSDVRITAATNRSLEEQIGAGRFREDLYYRINILSVKLPPLRERKACIQPLAHLLLEKICRSLRKKIIGFSPSVITWMEEYAWPGNIRQLANTIERAVILSESGMIQEESILTSSPVEPLRTGMAPSRPEPLKLHERELILKALHESLWIQKDAAGLLGISPRSLNYKIKKFGIIHPRWRKNR